MQKGVPNGVQNQAKIGLEPRLASRSNFDQFWGRFWVDFVTILGSFHRCFWAPKTEEQAAGISSSRQYQTESRSKKQTAKQQTNRKAANATQSSKRIAKQQTNRKAANETQSSKRIAKQQTKRKAATQAPDNHSFQDGRVAAELRRVALNLQLICG